MEQFVLGKKRSIMETEHEMMALRNSHFQATEIAQEAYDLTEDYDYNWILDFYDIDDTINSMENNVHTTTTTTNHPIPFYQEEEHMDEGLWLGSEITSSHDYDDSGLISPPVFNDLPLFKESEDHHLVGRTTTTTSSDSTSYAEEGGLSPSTLLPFHALSSGVSGVIPPQGDRSMRTKAAAVAVAAPADLKRQEQMTNSSGSVDLWWWSYKNFKKSDTKEMMYREAILRPLSSGLLERPEEGEAIKPKRRNVRISSDPQTSAARRRRERISGRLRLLQRLVPGGDKLDTASMLDEAANYLKFLKSQIRALGDRSTASSLHFPHLKP